MCIRDRVGRFRKGKAPLTRSHLSISYDIPIKVVSRICDNLHKAGFINFVVLSNDSFGVAPAKETGKLSVGELLSKLDRVGDTNFIPRFEIIDQENLNQIDKWLDECYECLSDKLISDIYLPEDIDKENSVNATPTPFLKTDDNSDTPVADNL